jgi:Short C-terminal domain
MPLMRRRPLLRAAAIGGGAYAAGERRRQAAEQREPAPTAPVTAAPPDQVGQLKQLADLHQNGVLTDEEFAAQKAKVLGT